MTVGSDFSVPLESPEGVVIPDVPDGQYTFAIKSISIISNEIEVELESFRRTIVAPSSILKLVDEPVQEKNESYNVSRCVFTERNFLKSSVKGFTK